MTKVFTTTPRDRPERSLPPPSRRQSAVSTCARPVGPGRAPRDRQRDDRPGGPPLLLRGGCVGNSGRTRRVSRSTYRRRPGDTHTTRRSTGIARHTALAARQPALATRTATQSYSVFIPDFASTGGPKTEYEIRRQGQSRSKPPKSGVNHSEEDDHETGRSYTPISRRKREVGVHDGPLVQQLSKHEGDVTVESVGVATDPMTWQRTAVEPSQGTCIMIGSIPREREHTACFHHPFP